MTSFLPLSQLSYIPTSRTSTCIPIGALNTKSDPNIDALVLSDAALSEDLKLLQTGESCAFAFLFTEYSDLSGKPPGFPQVKWCTSMGEFSYYRGDFTYSKSGTEGQIGAASPTDHANRPIRYECFTSLTEMHVGDVSEVVIRVYNTTNQAMSVHLDCKPLPASQTATSPATGTTIRPRLSVTPKATYANALAAGAASTKTNPDSGAVVSQSTAHRGLVFSGLTFTPLGIIESLDFVDVTVHVYATSAGLHDLPTLYIIDSITGDRHAVVAACRVLVQDSEEWLEEGAEAEAEYGVPEEKNDTAPQLIAEMLAQLPPAVVKANTSHPSADSTAATPLPVPAPVEVEEEADAEPIPTDIPPSAAEERDLQEMDVPGMSELEISDVADVSMEHTPTPALKSAVSQSDLSGLSGLSGQVLSELEIHDTDRADTNVSPTHLTAVSSVSADLASSMSRFIEESELEMEQLLSSMNSASNTPPPAESSEHGLDDMA